MSSEQADIALGTRWKHCLARTFPYRVFRIMECVAYGYPERVHVMMMTVVAVTLFKSNAK